MEESDIKKFLELGIVAIEKERDEFNAAGEWFSSLPEKHRAAILNSGADILWEYKLSKSGGLTSLIND